jgi:hypothetical protein
MQKVLKSIITMHSIIFLLKNGLKNLITFSSAGEPPLGSQLLEPLSFLFIFPKEWSKNLVLSKIFIMAQCYCKFCTKKFSGRYTAAAASLIR